MLLLAVFALTFAFLSLPIAGFAVRSGRAPVALQRAVLWATIGAVAAVSWSLFRAHAAWQGLPAIDATARSAFLSSGVCDATTVLLGGCGAAVVAFAVACVFACRRRGAT